MRQVEGGPRGADPGRNRHQLVGGSGGRGGRPARGRDGRRARGRVRAPERAPIEAADPRKAADAPRYLEQLPSRFPGVRVRSWIDTGNAAERLCALAEAEHAGTLVVGNKGADRPRWSLRESVPTEVVRTAPCAVLVVDTREAW